MAIMRVLFGSKGHFAGVLGTPSLRKQILIVSSIINLGVHVAGGRRLV